MTDFPLPRGVTDAEVKRAERIARLLPEVMPIVREFGAQDFIGSVIRERDVLLAKGYNVRISWINTGVRMEVRAK